MATKIGDTVYKLTRNIATGVYRLFVIKEEYCGYTRDGKRKYWALQCEGTKEKCIAVLDRKRKAVEKRT